MVERFIRNCDLTACANGQLQPPGDRYSPNDQAWGKKKLIQVRMFAIRPVSVIGFHFRTEIFHHTILERRVKQNWGSSPSLNPAIIGHGEAQSTLQIKIAPAFAKCDGWTVGEVMCRRVIASVGHGQTHEHGQNVIALFLVGGQQTVLNQEALIAPSVFVRRSILRLPRRYPDDESDVFGGNELQSLPPAATVIPFSV